ncbi:MAG: type II toxin-antitoxin system ParD family antitoxin [Xanthomonadales bacterium]|nr:type II toxin-antitoxin system ParD family antitoxin [Xanthomonadales bacterium]
MNFSLTPQLEHFVREYAATGGYNNASEVVREALRLFKRTEEERHLKLRNLRQAINKGDEAIGRGEVIDITSINELDDFFDKL